MMERTGAGQEHLAKTLHVPKFKNPTDGSVVRTTKCQPRGDTDGKLS